MRSERGEERRGLDLEGAERERAREVCCGFEVWRMWTLRDAVCGRRFGDGGVGN